MDPERWRQVEELFHAALALEPESQQTFLNEACGADAELRRELESLLARGEQAERFLETHSPQAEALTPGKTLLGRRLGHYEIMSLLGGGGMGEVYRGRDTSLNRDVAIKVLPGEFTSDREFVARFEGEARVLAALNHQHICAIFGIEEGEGIRALVLELVEGATLADRLKKGQLKAPDALRIARQIAEALDAAHERGIVHRDLKPSNVMITLNGNVKVLDFGLAKAAAHESSSPDLTLSLKGSILGTPAYMSPEQARGNPVDRRSDIWAFGVVVYEMLTGRRAFDGESLSDVLAHVLTKEPDWDALPPETPAPILRLLRRCLTKDHTARLDSALAARLEIDDAMALPGAATPVAQRRSRRIAPLAGAALAAGVALATLGAWVLLRQEQSGPSKGTAHLAIVLPAAYRMPISENYRDLDVSPDGRYICFRVSGLDSGGALAVRALDREEVRLFPEIKAAVSPFFSPDSRWIGFTEGGDLKKVSVAGGVPIVIRRRFGGDATWTDDNTIVTGGDSGLRSLPANGGEPTLLHKKDPSEGDYAMPSALPDGRGILFTITETSPWIGGTARRSVADADNVQVAVLDLATGRHKILVRGGTAAQYARSGHLLYAIGGTLFAARFDLARLELVGDPAPVVQDLEMALNAGAAAYGVSREGTLVYVPGTSRRRTLMWVDRKGEETAVPAPPRAYHYVKLSPDGSRAALDIREEQELYVWDFRQQSMTRLTFDPCLDTKPVWTPDGRRVMFASTRDGRLNLYWQAADGTGAAQRVTRSETAHFVNSITPDGAYALGAQWSPKSEYDIVLYPLKGLVKGAGVGSTPEPNPSMPQTLVQTPAVDYAAMISPDGRFFAYLSAESGRAEIYVRPFPRVNDGRWQVSVDGGSAPVWARSGRELFYLNNANELMSVPVQPAATTFSAGAPTKLLEAKYAVPGQFGTYDVSPDGSRFLMLKESGRPDGTRVSMIVVLNWFAELKAAVR